VTTDEQQSDTAAPEQDELDVPASPEVSAEADESELQSSADAETADAETGDAETGDAETGDDESDDDDAGDDESDDDDDADEGESKRPVGLAARLEREGEIAADFLERLLDIADLDGDLDVDVEGERASVAIVDSSEGRVPRRLVGTDGEVLEALQELTRLAVQARTGDRTRLMLDVAGHRARRREQLVIRAQEAIDEVKQSGEPLRLEAMNPFERKIVHDAVAGAGLSSSSEGAEPDRRIVVRPAE
jgi:spoIIIJ-associated protein